jgi:hypothetical protein
MNIHFVSVVIRAWWGVWIFFSPGSGFFSCSASGFFWQDWGCNLKNPDDHNPESLKVWIFSLKWTRGKYLFQAKKTLSTISLFSCLFKCAHGGWIRYQAIHHFGWRFLFSKITVQCMQQDSNLIEEALLKTRLLLLHLYSIIWWTSSSSSISNLVCANLDGWHQQVSKMFETMTSEADKYWVPEPGRCCLCFFFSIFLTQR